MTNYSNRNVMVDNELCVCMCVCVLIVHLCVDCLFILISNCNKKIRYKTLILTSTNSEFGKNITLNANNS